jgi:imidazolonepropionase-like amidohydrolase
MRRPAIGGLTVFGALAALTACTAPAGGPLVVVGATLIDGTGNPPLRDAFVVVEGDRIKAVGPQAMVPLPKGARVFDARGKFIVPNPDRLTRADAGQALAARIRAGATPLQALVELAAGHTLEPGRPADLAILNSDPTQSPGSPLSVFRVVSGGRLQAAP